MSVESRIDKEKAKLPFGLSLAKDMPLQFETSKPKRIPILGAMMVLGFR
jgi:hypothetical protein